MSRIRFLCPECSAKLSVESDSAHQFTKCPKCNKSIRAWGARLLDIKFSCKSCDKKLIIDVEAAGKEIKCPGCRTINLVPAGSNAPMPEIKRGESNSANKPQSVQPGRSVPLLTSEEVSFLVGEPE